MVRSTKRPRADEIVKLVQVERRMKRVKRVVKGGGSEGKRGGE